MPWFIRGPGLVSVGFILDHSLQLPLHAGLLTLGVLPDAVVTPLVMIVCSCVSIMPLAGGLMSSNVAVVLVPYIFVIIAAWLSVLTCCHSGHG